MRRLLLLPLLLLGIAAGARPAQAAEGLSVKLKSLVPRSRSDAPIGVEAEFDWKGRALLEGRLEMTFKNGNELMGLCRSAEMSLTSGLQRFRMLLPAMSVANRNWPLNADVCFVTERGRVELDSCILFVSSVSERSLVVCASDPWEGLNPQHSRVAQSLRLERFNPDPGKPSETTLFTFPARLRPEELPTYPLGYCSYDIVSLAGDGFSYVQRRQLEALRRWVQAGGSVCVLPQGPLKPYHAAFLNDLAGGGKPAFGLDEKGYLETVSGFPMAGIGMYASGLGRSVVVLRSLDSDSDFDAYPWRQAVAFLWKIRADQVDHIANDGKWRTGQKQRSMRPARYPGEYSPRTGFQRLPLESAGQLVQVLTPQTVRLIPFWVIALILVLFVLAIGPVDYFLLGILKQRRLTWVLFPLFSVGFALFAVYLSEHYMRRVDQRQAFVLVDLGRDGRVLRQNRFELLFAAREREAVTEVKSALFTPIDHKRLVDYSRAGGYMALAPRDKSCLPWYEGRMPIHFNVIQEIRQWSPQLNRVFTLRPMKTELNLNWDELDPSSFRYHNSRRTAARLLLGETPEQDRAPSDQGSVTAGSVYLFNMSNMYIAHRDVKLSVPESFLRQVCVRPEVGLFSIVSQISPTGADNFEDLALLDSSDPNQWLLVVVIREGEDYIIYRRLYHAGE